MASAITEPRAPPVIDFGPSRSSDAAIKQDLVDQIRNACLEKGFFQITNHGISEELRDDVFDQCKEFFSLPLAEKLKTDLRSNPHNRGYEVFRSQDFEKTGRGDLKEAFYLGRDIPSDHPAVQAKQFNMGPNQYPTSMSDPGMFKSVMDEYHAAMTGLAMSLLKVLAISLDLSETWFDDFSKEPMAILRLLHYPPQEPSSKILEKGIGAHTDFGAITLLMQDAVGGLQVFDAPTTSWVDVKPIQGAFVVNLGNLMMRWTNDRYVSNLHRVINTSGRERYSVPFFFAGNPDFLVKCLPTCEDPEEGAKYEPVTVGNWMQGRYADTYVEKEKDKAVSDMSKHLVNAI